MGPPAVHLVLVVALGLTATLPGITISHAQGTSVPAKSATSKAQDNLRGLPRREQNFLDKRLTTKLDSDLNKRNDAVDTRLDRIEERLDGIELTLAKQQVYTGCDEALSRGVSKSGVYTVSPDGIASVRVYCEQQTEGGGWMVFQSRYDGTVNFQQDWAACKAGFGELTGEFWLGNDNIHALTKHHNMELLIELTSPAGVVRLAKYRQFWIDDGAQNYKLTVSGYNGTQEPGDAFSDNSGSAFTTKDQDNDVWSRNCALEYMGAWWFTDGCGYTNLNGIYGSYETGKGVLWSKWQGFDVSMKASRMMVRKKT